VISGSWNQCVNMPCSVTYQLVSKLTPGICESKNEQSALYGAYLWSTVTDVVELTENWQAQMDLAFVNWPQRVRLGIMWDGTSSMTEAQWGNGENYEEGDYEVLKKWRLQYISIHYPILCFQFVHAPIVIEEMPVWDAINRRKICTFAVAHGQQVHFYHSVDTFCKSALLELVQHTLWKLSSSKTEDALGMLPLCLGLPVMVTENSAQSNKVINGTEGHVKWIIYNVNKVGDHFAACIYVRIHGSNVKAIHNQPDIIPIIPVKSSFKFVDDNRRSYNIQCVRLPLLPPFAFTDYKIQGWLLSFVIVDLSGLHSLQSVYVMLSRAKRLDVLVILCWFPAQKVNQCLMAEFQEELEWLHNLAI